MYPEVVLFSLRGESLVVSQKWHLRCEVFNEADFLCNIPSRNITRAPEKVIVIYHRSRSNNSVIQRGCYFQENIAEISEQMRLAHRRQVAFSSLKQKIYTLGCDSYSAKVAKMLKNMVILYTKEVCMIRLKAYFLQTKSIRRSMYEAPQ
jgi:hypothetical protein